MTPDVDGESSPDAELVRSIPLPDWPDDLPRRLIEPDRPASEPLPNGTVLVAGDRAAVRFRPGSGIDEIRIHPHTAARAFRIRTTPDASERVEVAPGTVRRRLALAHGSLVESALVLQRLPGVVLQWEHTAPPGRPDRRTEPGDPSAPPARTDPSEPGNLSRPDEPGDPPHATGSTFDLEVSWSLPAAARPELPDGPSGPLLIYTLDPESGSRSRSPSESGPRQSHGPALRVEPVGAEVSWESTPEPPSPSRGARRSSDGADGADDHSPARDRPGHRITLRSSLEVGQPLTLLFAKASGEAMQRAAIQRRAGSLDAELIGRAGADARAAETELVLRTDDPRSDEAFAWRRRELHGAVGHDGDGTAVLRDPRGGAASPLGRVDVATIGTDLLALGRHRDAAAFVDRAVDLLADEPAAPAALLLFVARHTLWTGDPRPLRRLGTRLEEWLTHSGISSSISRELHRTVVECADAVEAAGERERADRIRGSLGSSEDLQGEGPDPIPATPPMAFVSPSDLLLEMLGGRADAFVGRLRLAPRVPEGRTRMAVEGIRMGDSRMRLSYHAAGSRHTFRLEPTEGRVPMNLVFEPLLSGPGPERTWVDGDRADVDRYRSGDRIGVRLQLPLDAPREVVLEEETEGGG